MTEITQSDRGAAAESPFPWDRDLVGNVRNNGDYRYRIAHQPAATQEGARAGLETAADVINAALGRFAA